MSAYMLMHAAALAHLIFWISDGRIRVSYLRIAKAGMGCPQECRPGALQ